MKRRPAPPPKPRPLGERNPAHPRPGFFLVRLVKGGPLVAAVIFRHCPMVPAGYSESGADPIDWCCPHDRGQPLACLIDGRPGDIDRVWIYGRPVPPAEYAYRLSFAEWARRYAPHLPEANPRRPVELAATPSLY